MIASNKIIDFVLKSLFYTTIFIILYNSFLDFLNFAYPPPVAPLVLNVNPIPNPEPYDIPLYLIFSLLIVASIFFFEFYIKKLFANITFSKKNQRFFFIIKIFALVFLGSIFLTKIGQFPLPFDPFLYKLAADKTIYWVFFISYLATVSLLIAQLIIVRKILGNKKSAWLIIYMFLSVFIILFSFDPGFYLQAHDARFFYGPVWEIVHGKTILTEIPSQYGFLSVLFFSLIHKITHANFIYLPIIIVVMYIFEYLICFYLILKTGRSLSLAIIGFFSILTTNYFAVYHLPQGGPLRWLPLFIAIFLFYRSKKLDAKRDLFLLPILSIWTIDAGLALVISYIMTIGFLFIARQISPIKIIRIIFYLVLSTFSIMLIINLIHIALGMQPVNFLLIYEGFRIVTSNGALTVPMEPVTYFWLFMLLYFASIIYFFSLKTREANIPDLRDLPAGRQAWGGPSRLSWDGREPTGDIKSRIELPLTILFSANLMFISSLYYVGRSMPHNLFQLAPFFVLTLYLLIGSQFRLLTSIKLRSTILISLFFLLIVFPSYYKKEYFTSDLINKYKLFREGPLKSDIDEKINKRFLKEARLIKDNIKEDEALILHPDESYLFYMVDKKNLLDSNPQSAMGTLNGINQAIKSVIKLCPSKIAIDCKIHKKCPYYKSYTDGWYHVIPSILERIEKKCGVIYESTVCTNQLCIAEKRTN